VAYDALPCPCTLHGPDFDEGPSRPALSRNHRYPLDLEEDRRIRETRNGNGGARREISLEYLRPNFRHPRRQTRVNQKHGHCHKIGELGARFCERALDGPERLLALFIEVPSETGAVIGIWAVMTR
jgi:hypothetical protein